MRALGGRKRGEKKLQNVTPQEHVHEQTDSESWTLRYTARHVVHFNKFRSYIPRGKNRQLPPNEQRYPVPLCT